MKFLKEMSEICKRYGREWRLEVESCDLTIKLAETDPNTYFDSFYTAIVCGGDLDPYIDFEELKKAYEDADYGLFIEDVNLCKEVMDCIIKHKEKIREMMDLCSIENK